MPVSVPAPGGGAEPRARAPAIGAAVAPAIPPAASYRGARIGETDEDLADDLDRQHLAVGEDRRRAALA